MMEPAGTFNGYFELVDDFFTKTFRDDCTLFLSMETRQYSSVVEEEPLIGGGATANAEAKPAPSDSLLPGAKLAQDAKEGSNYVAFSPRMALRRDGSALGKVKLLCGFRVPSVCLCEQGLILNSEGVVAGTMKLKNLIDGLTVGGCAAVNMIAPASEDVTAVNVRYHHKDFYYGTSYQRNGLGSSNLLVDTGTTFFNILAGAGFERQRLSYLEQRDSVDQVDVIYAGVGFTGVDWSIAAKMARSTDAWNSVRLALFQKLSPSTLVACAYNYELNDARAHVSLGFTQGFRVRLPAYLQPSRTTAGGDDDPTAAVWSTVAKFLIACKAESSGLFAATIRGRFNDSIHWGVVAQRNMLQEGSPVRFGLTISMETDQSTTD